MTTAAGTIKPSKVVILELYWICIGVILELYLCDIGMVWVWDWNDISVILELYC